jgi:hypothetical protein
MHLRVAFGFLVSAAVSATVLAALSTVLLVPGSSVASVSSGTTAWYVVFIFAFLGASAVAALLGAPLYALARRRGRVSAVSCASTAVAVAFAAGTAVAFLFGANTFTAYAPFAGAFALAGAAGGFTLWGVIPRMEPTP